MNQNTNTGRGNNQTNTKSPTQPNHNGIDNKNGGTRKQCRGTDTSKTMCSMRRSRSGPHGLGHGNVDRILAFIENWGHGHIDDVLLRRLRNALQGNGLGHLQIAFLLSPEGRRASLPSPSSFSLGLSFVRPPPPSSAWQAWTLCGGRLRRESWRRSSARGAATDGAVALFAAEVSKRSHKNERQVLVKMASLRPRLPETELTRPFFFGIVAAALVNRPLEASFRQDQRNANLHQQILPQK